MNNQQNNSKESKDSFSNNTISSGVKDTKYCLGDLTIDCIFVENEIVYGLGSDYQVYIWAGQKDGWKIKS